MTDKPILVSPDEAAGMLAITRTEVFKLIRSGELRSGKYGKRRLISVASIEEWADRKMVEALEEA